MHQMLITIRDMTLIFPDISSIKLRIKSEIWKSWAKILIGRRFRQYPQKV